MRHDSQVASGGFPSIRIAAEPGKDRSAHRDVLPSPSTRLALLEMTIERLTAAGYVYIGMDHFALPSDELVRAQAAGNLHRNFQGYSTRAHCDIVGMGVSSIGKVAHVYAQNQKTLRDYYAALP